MTDLLVADEVVLGDVEAVLFDKDGTLVDIHHYFATIVRLRADLLADRWGSRGAGTAGLSNRLVEAMGVDLATGRMKPEGPVGVKQRPEIAAVASRTMSEAGLAVSPDEVEEVFAEVDRRTAADLAPLVRLLPGAEDLLRGLTARGVLVGVVTTDLTHRAEAILRVAGLDAVVAVVVGGDSTEEHKPSAAPALLALDLLGVRAERSVVVGDHVVDVRMAVAAGCGGSIGVLTGIAGTGTFEGEPCVVVDDLTALALAGGRE